MNAPVIALARADLRLVFLARVSGWHYLVECGELDLVEAFDLVVDAVNDPGLFQIVVPPPVPVCDVCLRAPCRTHQVCEASRKWIERGRRI